MMIELNRLIQIMVKSNMFLKHFYHIGRITVYSI